MSAVLVRAAHKADIPEVVRIHNYHALKVGGHATETGFLLERVSREEIAYHFSRPSDSVYVATDAGGKVLGFSVITTELPREISEVTWESDEDREWMTRKKQCHVLSVAVRPDTTGQGVAEAIYAELYRLYDGAVVSAFVVTKPVVNQPSLNFHEKQGFRCVGVFSRIEYRGLKGYQSRLLARFSAQENIPGRYSVM